MHYTNLKDETQRVDFAEAVATGLGRNQGLFMPESIPRVDDPAAFLAQPFIERSINVLAGFVGSSIPTDVLAHIVREAFSFPVPVVQASPKTRCLELFHGPTLAFKDFGARFLARSLSYIAGDRKITILTATSGDTGAAVAHAFHGLDNIRCAILYPAGKISPLQEKLFCTLGGNIHTFAVDGAFDDCQTLVKQAFDVDALRKDLALNSANSINIARLVAQICYYWEGVAQIPAGDHDSLVIAVPSGNFGNLTAGLIAKAMGLPAKRYIAATNRNDTVPRFLATGEWEPNPTVPTMSNAMDVSAPNNWPRVEALFARGDLEPGILTGFVTSESETEAKLRTLNGYGYVSEPHAAVAFRALEERLVPGENGLFLGTAHPAKFLETVERVLGTKLALPEPLAAVADKGVLSVHIPNDFGAFERELRTRLG